MSDIIFAEQRPAASIGNTMPALTLPLPLLLALLTALSPLAIDMYLPAMEAMAGDLQTSIHLVELSVSSYLLGFALGQLGGGPLSDRYGRRPLIITGLVLFALSSAALMLTTSLEALLALRFLQAIGGGLATVNSSAIVRDRFQGADVAKTLSLVSMIMMLAPLVAPMLGALTLSFAGWRTIFQTLTIYAVLVLIILVWQLEESHPPHKRQQRLPVRDYLRVIRHVRARRFILAQALASTGMFVFITASPYLYLDYFEQDAGHFPWLFGANVLTMMAMNRLNILLLRRFDSQQILRAGLSLQLSSALLLVLLFSAYPQQASLSLTLPLMMLFIGSLGLISANATATILHYFRDISATATALTGVSVFCSGSLFGLIWGHLHNGTPLPMMAVMLCTALLANLALCRIPAEQSDAVTTS